MDFESENNECLSARYSELGKNGSGSVWLKMGVVESMSYKVRLNSLNKILLNKNSRKFYNQNGNYD